MAYRIEVVMNARRRCKVPKQYTQITEYMDMTKASNETNRRFSSSSLDSV